MTAPQPVQVETCDTCKQPWATHTSSARARARAERADLIESGVFDTDQGLPPIEWAITYLDCVLALQEANRGPMGYVGPQGPMGMPGCKHA